MAAPRSSFAAAMLTLVAFVVALAALIVIHELGHYLVARWCGVKVLRFSVGFGRPVYTRVAGADRTEWVIGLIPLGGYVKMADEREDEVAPEDLPRAFNRQSVWRRIAIVIAGPLANFLLAIVLYWALFVHGVPGMRPVVAAPAAGSIAAIGGFADGDVVRAVGGDPVRQWQDVRLALLTHAVERAVVAVEVTDAAGRPAQRRLDFTGIESRQIDEHLPSVLGLSLRPPVLDPVIGRVVPGAVADRAGLAEGDRVVAVDGQPVADWAGLVRVIRASPGRELQLEVDRGGRAMPTVRLTPEPAADGGQTYGRIGIGPRVDPAVAGESMVDLRYGPVEALGQAVLRTWDTSVLSLQMLGRMLVGDVSIRNLSGPITIADYAGQSAQVGWIAYLTFLALISISLGVLNLLPIPMLDGGHLMYYAIEVVRRRPVSDRAMMVGQQVGMGVLFVLMAFAIFNDIHRLLGG